MGTTHARSTPAVMPLTGLPHQPHASFAPEEEAIRGELPLDVLKLLDELESQAVRADSALRTLGKSLSANATNPYFFYQLGRALQQRGRHEQAAQHYRRAIQIQPQFIAAYGALAALQRAQGNPGDALTTLRQGLGLVPRSATLHAELAVGLESQQQSAEAEKHLRLALEIEPTLAGAWFRLGGMLQQEGRAAEARDCFSQGVLQQPLDQETRRVRSLVALQLGDLAAGWEDFDLRHTDGHRQALAPPLTWDEDLLAKQTILVRSEGNLADDIMFASCLGQFARLVARCVVQCEPAMGAIVARSFPDVAMFDPAMIDKATNGFPAHQLGADAEIYIGSLPRYLRPSWKHFPAQRSYLQADAVRARYWQDRLRAIGGGVKVGLAWRAPRDGGATVQSDVELRWWEEVLRVPGVRFVSLQRGDCAADTARARESLGTDIHEVLPSSRDSLDDAAALISALDLVICAPNTVAHLAGAVGAPTWVVLPSWPSWRWPLDGEACPWYPSLRLFRQPRRGAWPEVFAQVAAHLRNAETANCTGK